MIRTPDDAYDAGARAAAQDPPLTGPQLTAVALLLAPYRPVSERAA